MSEGKTNIKDLSDELKDYEYYIINRSGILDESLTDKEDNIYLKWNYSGKTSTKEFLRHAIQKRWINRDVIKGSQQYITTDEIYQLIIDNIRKSFKDNREFKKSC